MSEDVNEHRRLQDFVHGVWKVTITADPVLSESDRARLLELMDTAREVLPRIDFHMARGIAHFVMGSATMPRAEPPVIVEARR